MEYFESVKLVALRNLDGRTQGSQHLIGKVFSGMPTIGQNAFHRLKRFRATLKKPILLRSDR